MCRSLAAVLVVLVLCGCGGDVPSAGTVVVDRAEGATSRLLVEREVELAGTGESGPVVVGSDAEWGDAWPAAGLPGEPPDVDFGRSLVILHRVSFGSGCEPIFRRLRIDDDAFTPVEMQFVGIEPGTVCAADERWYVVAVEARRDAIPPDAVMRWGERAISVP